MRYVQCVSRRKMVVAVSMLLSGCVCNCGGDGGGGDGWRSFTKNIALEV